MAAKKNRKLFQVAKELNLATSTLTEELESQGYKVTKAQMTVIDDEMYGNLLRKFAPDRLDAMKREASMEEARRQEAETQQMKDAEVERIYQMGKDETPPKKPAPSTRKIDNTEIRPFKDPEKPAPKAVEPEPEVPAEEKEAPRPAAKKKAAPSVRGAAEVAPKRDEAPQARTSAKEEPAAPTDEDVSPDAPRGKRTASPSVRGGVSNDDILAFTPPPPKPERPAPVAPSPQVHTPKDEEDDEKPRGKRKRKRKPGRGGEQPGADRPKTGGGGWVSTGDSSGSGKRKRKRDKKKKPDAAEVQASIKQTLAAMEGSGKKRKKRRVQTEIGMIDEDTNLLKITEFVSTQELADLMDIQVVELIKECMMLGLRVTINQRLDKDTITLLAEEHEYKVEFVDDLEQQEMMAETVFEDDDTGEKVPRAPVVTIMGHVDHGKTTLLDFIRKSAVAEGEAGGITQHIGAYEIEHNDNKITFLDTPGHEAFTAMRARGAQVTDVVVLVVAADDQVMPQTVEAIDHAKAADVPMVVAINKMDKPGANAEKVRQQLADHGVLVEEWGGEVQAAEVSAKKGTGIPDLLDKILLSTEILDLKAVKDTQARGYVIESKQEKGRGTVCTILIQRGTLKVGDVFVAGHYFGRVRAMYDERGEKRTNVLPGQPVQITGFESPPHVGDQLIVFKEEREAKEIASRRQQQQREQAQRISEGSGRGDLLQFVGGSEKRELQLVIKGDVDGSVEAIADSLMRLSTEEVQVKIIRRAVGPINESDILLASASNAMVIGFNVHPNIKAREMAQINDVPFETYRIIYELIEDIKGIIIGMHRRETAEEVVGMAEVRDTFKISRIGTIAGCYVVEGKIERSNRVRIIRDGTEIYTGELDTLKRFKDDAKEVAQGYECGIKVQNYNDIKVGDMIQAFKIVEVDREIEVGM
ncbi:translation initiation factor IF-2 [bacterium]|nr:translation initiation factor IF-2 [bacterium]